MSVVHQQQTDLSVWDEQLTTTDIETSGLKPQTKRNTRDTALLSLQRAHTNLQLYVSRLVAACATYDVSDERPGRFITRQEIIVEQLQGLMIYKSLSTLHVETSPLLQLHTGVNTFAHDGLVPLFS